MYKFIIVLMLLVGCTPNAGSSGTNGSNGNQGPAGDQGPPGEQGPPGQGVTGRAGPQGPTGPQGPQGPQGLKGTTGYDGLPGLPGVQGIQGFTGIQGQQGTQGVQGPPGVAGPKGGFDKTKLYEVSLDVNVPQLTTLNKVVTCTAPEDVAISGSLFFNAATVWVYSSCRVINDISSGSGLLCSIYNGVSSVKTVTYSLWCMKP